MRENICDERVDRWGKCAKVLESKLQSGQADPITQMLDTHSGKNNHRTPYCYQLCMGKRHFWPQDNHNNMIDN